MYKILLRKNSVAVNPLFFLKDVYKTWFVTLLHLSSRVLFGIIERANTNLAEKYSFIPLGHMIFFTLFILI